MKKLKDKNSGRITYFTKMNGSDNDFVVIDNRKDIISQRASFARSVCQRRSSVGADGLILIENSRRADFRMRIFNPDGSEAEMCGNGARCAALYGSVKLHRPSSKKQTIRNLKIETKAGILGAEVVAAQTIKLKMSQPEDVKLDFRINVDKKPWVVSYINTGVPHTVLFVTDINKVDVYNLGKKIRYHSHFQPQGTNVDFVKVKDKNSVYIRTYERGVEDETLACGTGSVAAAIIAGLKEDLRSPVSVHTRGGEVLRVHFNRKNDKINDVYLEGKVKFVFEGKIET